jgi:hypothetical protein
MIGKIPARVGRLVTAVMAVGAVMALGAGAASAAETIYSDFPTPKPGNVVSVGFEATSASQFGGQVEFGGTARKNPTVKVMMSSWGCQSGTWYEKNCNSAMGSKFEWPIGFSVYEVGPEDTIGALIAAGSKTFKMPYRPAASPKCTGESAGAWYSKGTCFNGKAFKLTLPLKVAKLPSKVIITIAYNTSHYGATPQAPQPCNSEPQGCPYDSLNVGVQDGFENPSGTPPSPGAFPKPDLAYFNGSPEAEWTGFQPLFEVTAK